MRPALTFTGVAITGTLIERGEHAMMAADGIYPDPAPGRVRPGHGKTHKACAALCARGGLPLAFAETGRCAEGTAALLFLSARGKAFWPQIIPWVADPVIIRGRIVEVAGLRQVPVKFEDVVRLQGAQFPSPSFSSRLHFPSFLSRSFLFIAQFFLTFCRLFPRLRGVGARKDVI